MLHFCRLLNFVLCFIPLLVGIVSESRMFSDADCNSNLTKAQVPANIPQMQPSPTELADMAQRANEVVRLLEELRLMYLPPTERGVKIDTGNVDNVTSADDHRPPKRPWEDMTKDGPSGSTEATFHEVCNLIYS